MTTETRTVVDPNTGLNDYIQITDKAQYLSIKNWETVSEPNRKDPTSKPFIKFVADVWKYGESKDLLNVCADKPKQFESTHIDLRRKLNALLEDKDKNVEVLIRVKVVDATKKPIVYDVEVA